VLITTVSTINVRYSTHIPLVLPEFKLQENCGSDRSWVWTCPADYSDEVPKEEVLAIRFANSESTNLYYSNVHP
jgi:hypothetical protein